jgi:hypothetical protein
MDSGLGECLFQTQERANKRLQPTTFSAGNLDAKLEFLDLKVDLVKSPSAAHPFVTVVVSY